MVIHVTDRLVVVLQTLVGFLATHVHVEPEYFFVVGADDQVVTLGVDGDARDPLGTRLVLFDNRLHLQVVLEDRDVGCREEVRLSRMEGHALDDALGLREGLLGRTLAEGMDDNLGC